jgi:hypothetical protein
LFQVHDEDPNTKEAEIMSDKRFYTRERAGWFNGGFTHVVEDIELDAVICASNEPGCDLVAYVMNNSVTPISYETL